MGVSEISKNKMKRRHAKVIIVKNHSDFDVNNAYVMYRTREQFEGASTGRSAIFGTLSMVSEFFIWLWM